MHESVVNHFSVSVDKSRSKFLINPGGLHFSLIKASDLILIDGRYRVLTALCIHQYLRRNKKKSLIIIDDYKERKFYHILKNFFEIKIIGRFGILERIKNRDVTNLIDKYSLDYR